MRIRSRGVTLIEMLIVVTIIGLFTGAVVVRYFGYVERAKHTAAESQIATFTNALAALHLDCGRPPAPDARPPHPATRPAG